MKVLLLTTNCTGPGGVQYVGRLLWRALSDAVGTDGAVTLFTLKDRPGDLGSMVEGPVVAGGGGRWRAGWSGLRLLRSEPWDLVMLGHLNLAPLLLGVNRRRRPATVAWMHGIEGWQTIGRVRRRGLLRVDRLLYNSKHTRQRSEAANPWLARLDACICPLGLLPEDNLPLAEKPMHDSFALVIGRMAAAESYKGHEELIRAWPAVQRSRPGLRLVIIGDGDDRPRLEAIARDIGADVRFVGRVDDPTRNAYLHACRCFCLPSKGEGFGLVYLEAMRAGKPVLTSNGDAGQEVIVDGVTGCAVDPGDRDDLVRGVLEVSGERAEEMGQAGRRRFELEFTYEGFRDRFSQRIHEVIGIGARP